MTWLVLGFAACASCFGLAACSPSFSDCTSSRDCPAAAASNAAQTEEAGAPGHASGEASGGGSGTKAEKGEPSDDASSASTDGANSEGAGVGSSGGSDSASAGTPADDAGAAGAEPTPECVRDADCSDHLACNGSETCRSGACVPGVAPCANPDPAHCDALCAEINGAASCTVRGQDKDKDGHFSSACLAKPGDDCNDAAASVYTGAPELCDHIDNDCDGKVDVNDGLSVSGSNVVIAPGNASLPTIAWATDRAVYGIAYRYLVSAGGALMFEEVDKSGAVTLQPESFTDAATPEVGYDGGYSLTSLTWGGNTFGAVWQTATGVAFRTIGGDGRLGATVPISVPTPATYAQPQVARNADGTWAVLYEAYGDATELSLALDANTISSSGVLSPTMLLGTPISELNLSATGSNFVFATNNYGTDDVGLWGPALASPKPLISGRDSLVGSGANGFAITSYSTGSSTPRFSAFALNGTKQCGPVNLPAGFVPQSIVGTATGYLVASAIAVQVQEVLSDCTLGQLLTLDPGPTHYVRIAGSPAGYGVVWQDANTGNSKRRLFGPRYCD